jgi:hypothetical protein
MAGKSRSAARRTTIEGGVLNRNHFVLLIAIAGLLPGSVTDSESAFRKLESIEIGTAKPGSRVSFTQGEINAWMRDQAKMRVPQGVRNLRVELGAGRATGSVDIDFLKIQQAAGGGDPGWLIKNLFAGEHPVLVTARFQSANGKGRVDVERVEVSGVPIEGRALDFVIAQYVKPTFPDVKVNEWFALRYGVDKFALAPNSVTVFMANKR